jgi:hypothetical protein
MSKPQQPELGRSGHTPVVEGQHAKEVIQGQEQPEAEGSTGPVPEPTGPGITPTRNRTSPTWSAFGAGWPASQATAERFPWAYDEIHGWDSQPRPIGD